MNLQVGHGQLMVMQCSSSLTVNRQKGFFLKFNNPNIGALVIGIGFWGGYIIILTIRNP